MTPLRKRVEDNNVFLEDDDGRVVLTAYMEKDTVTLRNGDWMLLKDLKADHELILRQCMPPTQSMKFRFFDITMEIRTNIPDIAKDFGDMYCRFADDFDGQADVTMHAMESWYGAPYPFVLLMKCRPGLRLKGDFSNVSYLSRVVDLLLQVHNESEVLILLNNPHHAFIHGAAVEKNGIGYVMPAESGKGKTTLTLALLSAGYGFLSDEFAVLDFETRLLKAFPRSLSVRDGSLGLFPNLHRMKHDLQRIVSPTETLYSIDPLSMMSWSMGRTCPVRFVIFPEYCPGSGPSLARISKADVIKRLISTRSFISLGLLDKERSMDLIMSIVAESECYRLSTADIEGTIRLVDQLHSSCRDT